MKKIIILLMSALCFSIILSGCKLNQLAVPEEVKVKTNESAVYEFPILSFDSEKNDKLDMSKYFDLEKLIKGDSEDGSSESNSNFNIYKYNDGKSKFQQYLLHMPIKEIDFEFGDSFGNMDFSNAIQGFNIDKEFSIPDVSGIDEKKEVDLTSIETAVNGAVSFYGTTESVPTTPTFVSNDAFDSVTYNSGKLIVNCNISEMTEEQKDALSNGLGIPLYFNFDVDGSMALYDKNDNLIAKEDFKDNKAVFDISGKTLTSSGMKLVYDGTTYGAPYVATFSSDSEIKIAEGVTFAPGQFTNPTANVSFPVSLGEQLGKVTIETGSLTIDLAAPEWSPGVISAYTIDVTGGIECSVDDQHKTANLSGKELKNQDINASAEVQIVLNDATIDFENPPVVTVQTNISKISAVVKMDDSFDTSISQDNPVPTDLTDYVNSIAWKKVGFDVKATNNLPAGNDMKLNISSKFLGIPAGTAQTIESGKKDENGEYAEQVLHFINESADLEHPFTTAFTGANAVTSMDITGAIQLNTDAQNNLIVTDVEPGKQYNISLKVEPVFEWLYADVKMPDNVSDFSGEFNTGINKKTMFESLGNDVSSKLDAIEFSAMPLYLFASVPELSIFDEASFGGVIKAFYGKEVDSQTNPGEKEIQQITLDKDAAYIFGEYDTTTGQILAGEIDISGMAPMPVLTKNEADEVNIIFEQSDLDFAKALNLPSGGEDTTLCISYKVGLGTTTTGGTKIFADHLEELKANGKSTIVLDLAVVLTVSFSLNEPIELDLMDLMTSDDSNNSNNSGSSGNSGNSNQNKDILSRTEPTNMDDYEQYLELVKYAKILIEDPKLPFSGTLNLKVKMYDDEDADTISLGEGKTAEVQINPTKLLKQYPLTPEIKLVIGDDSLTKSSFGLLRQSNVKGNLKLKVYSSGEAITVYPFSEQNNGGSN